jgi:hypothetical protein
MIVSIHQPNYIPWIGYFHKISNSDVFVIFDDVQLPRGKKNNFVIRNRIKTESGAKWLTVPVKNKSQMLLINKVEINNDVPWKEKHWNSISHNYSKAPFFKDYRYEFQKEFEKDYEYIAEFNVMLIKFFMRILEINTKIVFSSSLGVNKTGTEKILGIIEKLNCNKYITGSGPGSKKYVTDNENLFKKHGVELILHRFTQPVYPQQFNEFVPDLSIVDILFNIGKHETMRIINNEKL